jgi:nucleotide-binding universal stress UspA family protein
MIPIKHILVALDFSDTSARALEMARMLTDACGASMHLVHVIPHPFGADPSMNDKRGNVCRQLEALLDATDRDVRRATVSCEVGTPSVEIPRYAAAHEIGLIVMGTHRHGPTYQMATGSIADAVVRSAACPVLTVKGDQREPCGARSVNAA